MRSCFLLVCMGAVALVGCATVKPDLGAKAPGLSYRDLMLKDYDEMLAMVKKHTQHAHHLIERSDANPDWESEARLELTKAERLILSRPNSDNMVAKLIPEVRREIATFANYDELLEAMTKEGVEVFKGDLHLPLSMQTTYLFLLENLMSELRPEIAVDERQRACLEQIRDADIDIPRDVMAERKLQGMFLTESPSTEAKRILESEGFKKK